MAYHNSGMEELSARFPANGSGTRVALLDSGTDLSHPAFSSWQIEYMDFCNSPWEGKDEIGHGTHCAGAIMSVAPESMLLSGRIVMQASMFTYDALADGIYWATAMKANVICVCTGQGFGLESVGRIIEEFSLGGGCVVCAIGNRGRDGEEAGVFPARYPHAIAAGSVDDQGNLLPFVDMPEGTDVFCFGGMPFVAPWLHHQYAELGGTSISASLISGLLALAMSSGKLQLTPEFPTVKARLLSVMEKRSSPRGAYYVFDPLRLS
jgi:major intracellular serine protease